MAFLPFSPNARPWEPIALALRKLAQAAIDDVLDSRSLAPKVGLKVVDAKPIMPHLSEVERQHLTGDGPSRWSGGVLPIPLEDGSFVCILNPDHSRRRN